jgi:hypothetical protein
MEAEEMSSIKGLQPVLLILLANMCATPVVSQLNSASVFFTTHEVRLGAPVLKTLADLSAIGYTFQAIQHTDSNDSLTQWIVWPPADMSDTVGHLYARNNVIVGIEHRLSRHETLKDVYDSLFNALSDTSKEHATTCSVKTFRPNIKNGTLTQIRIGCGGITVTMDRADFKDEEGKIDEHYEVTEAIGVIK